MITRLFIVANANTLYSLLKQLLGEHVARKGKTKRQSQKQ